MKLFEFPEIVTLSGMTIGSEMSMDEIRNAGVGNNTCSNGGGISNTCDAGGGSSNGCSFGSGEEYRDV